MTTTNNEIGERIARVEENQQSTNQKLDYLIERFDKYVAEQSAKNAENDKKYVSMAQLRFTQFILGVTATAAGLFFILKDHIK